MLVLYVLGFEIISNPGELLILFIEVQELRFDFIVPDAMDLKFLVLKAAPCFELFIATHGVVHSV